MKFRERMRHVFQPCDQYVIKWMKDAIRVSWEENLEDVIGQANENDWKTHFSSSAPVLRKRCCSVLSYIVANIQENCILKSWEATGIPQILYSHIPSGPLNIDRLISEMQRIDLPPHPEDDRGNGIDDDDDDITIPSQAVASQEEDSEHENDEENDDWNVEHILDHEWTDFFDDYSNDDSLQRPQSSTFEPVEPTSDETRESESQLWKQISRGTEVLPSKRRRVPKNMFDNDEE